MHLRNLSKNESDGSTIVGRDASEVRIVQDTKIVKRTVSIGPPKGPLPP